MPSGEFLENTFQKRGARLEMPRVYKKRQGAYEYMRLWLGVETTVARLPAIFIPASRDSLEAGRRLGWRLYLISAAQFWNGSRFTDPWAEFRRAEEVLFIDSGAYQWLNKYPYTLAQYLEFAISVPGAVAFATMDILPGFDVREAQRKTVANTLTILYEAERRGIAISNNLVPVLHGDSPESYMEHFDMYRQAGVKAYIWAIGGVKLNPPDVTISAACALAKRVDWVHVFGATKRIVDNALCCIHSFDTATHVYIATKFGRVRVYHNGAFLELDNNSKNIDPATKIELSLKSQIEYYKDITKKRKNCV
jgi:hypothetical protein